MFPLRQYGKLDGQQKACKCQRVFYSGVPGQNGVQVLLPDLLEWPENFQGKV